MRARPRVDAPMRGRHEVLIVWFGGWVRSEALAKPQQLLDVGVVDDRGYPGLERDDTAVAALDDHVDLVVAPVSREVARGRFRGLRVHAQAERHQRLEQCSEEEPSRGIRMVPTGASCVGPSRTLSRRPGSKPGSPAAT